MTVPTQGPGPREQWGSGLPGIPSIWDTAPTASDEARTTWSTPRSFQVARAAGSSGRRWVGAAVGLVVLLAVGGVFSAGEDVVTGATSEVVAVPVPAPELPAPVPEAAPPGRAPL